MGEYAVRKSDGVEIKIGTCEDMYYLRYEDIDKIKAIPHSVNPSQCANELRFRLPFPDEDGMLPGEYEDFRRGALLYRASSVQGCSEEWKDESTANDPGSIQLTHKSGLLLGVPCYHGIKLPEVTKPMGAGWNGKSWAFELTQLRPTAEGVKPIIQCRFCDHKWRYDWADIWEYVPQDLRPALRRYYEAEKLQSLQGNACLCGAPIGPDRTNCGECVAS